MAHDRPTPFPRLYREAANDVWYSAQIGKFSSVFSAQPVVIHSPFLSGGSCGRSFTLARDPVPIYDGRKKFKLFLGQTLRKPSKTAAQ